MIYFSSDQHFNHLGLATEGITGKGMGRGFPTLDEHNETLLDAINSRVHSTDILYLLGDFAWTKPSKFRMQIRCKHIRFIFGNHDKRMESLNAFGECKDLICTKFSNGENVILSHYPQMYWTKSHYNAYHLYGHMHRQREDYLDNLLPDRRSMDVGVDNAKYLLGHWGPFSEDEILAHLSHRAGHDPLSYYRKNDV